MRFKDYLETKLNEFKIKSGYAGRGVSKLYQDPQVIVWVYMIIPEKKGLLWSKPDGSVYLGKKKIATFTVVDSAKVTHKQIIAAAYSELGLNSLEGDMRDNIENIYDQNVRGRLLKDELWVYDQELAGVAGAERSRYEKLVDEALREVQKNIPEGWWTKK